MAGKNFRNQAKKAIGRAQPGERSRECLEVEKAKERAIVAQRQRAPAKSE